MMSCPPLEMHRHFLCSVLSIRPLVEPLCELARQMLPPGEPLTATIAAMRRAAGDPRGSAAEDPSFQTARDQLAATLAETDVGGLLADLIVADLIDIEAGHDDQLTTRLATPQLRSPVHLRHVHHVRLTYQAMWHAVPLAP